MCRQLGFPGEGKEITLYCLIYTTLQAGGAHILDYGDGFETSKKDAVIGGVQCVGTEPELIECFHASIGNHNCGRGQTTPNIIISCSGT